MSASASTVPPPWSGGNNADFPLQRALIRGLEKAKLAVEITDPDGVLLYVNGAWESMTGYFADEALGHTAAHLIRSNAHDEATFDAIWAQIETGAIWHGELVSRRKDGETFLRSSTVVPTVDKHGQRTHILVVSREVTAGERSELRYQTLIEAADDAIMIADLQSAKFIEANPASQKMLGYSLQELRGMTGRNLCKAGQDELITEASRGLNEEGAAYVKKVRLVRRDGSELWAEMRMAVSHTIGKGFYLSVLRDVTSRVESEQELETSNRALRDAHEQLIRTSKLAAMGELAAGVAHEVNNPASFAMVNLSLIQTQLTELQAEMSRGADLNALQRRTEELTQLAAESLEGVRRITRITRDLNSFARVDDRVMGPVDMAEVVRVATRMAHNEIRHRATLDVKLDGRAIVRGDAARLTQVITNLLVNASHAIDEGAAAVNTICVSTEDLDGHVVITVRDSGKGIAKELQERIFDPFFTTKPRGIGTGLGLPMCGEIVRAHHGRIEVDSAEGEGATFRVWLPASDEVPTTVASAPPTVPSARPEKPVVLLIDDDVLVLRTYRRALTGRYEVIAAEGGAQGLHELDEHKHIDAIVCDLMMPDVDGPTVYEIVEKSRPDLCNRIVFCTGGVFTERIQSFARSHKDVLFPKPESREDLCDLVEHAIRLGVSAG